MQYFERAVFEYHPENTPPNDVLLSLLGSRLYEQKYPGGAAGQQTNNSPGSVLFPQTSKRLGGRFLEYWRSNGGLGQQGYPITEEFPERSDVDGNTYRVQYFERAVFELHPGNKAPYDVLLSQLGTLQLKQKYPTGVTEPPAPTSTPDVFANLEQRPLRLPTLPPGATCSPTQGRLQDLPAPAFPSSAYVLGSGPVYPVAPSDPIGDAISPNGVAHPSPQQNGTYRIKVPWISKPDYPGPALVRGRQLDGGNKVRFTYAQYYNQPQDEMRLDESNDNGTNYGWSFWPSGVEFASSGCYGLQIDGVTFTEAITFRVVAQP
ncbi:MAG: hypothetical protein M3014_05015 [Chloroflexota bacterium]|nr:hypothetical protein [Chloroflexota bacterium]